MTLERDAENRTLLAVSLVLGGFLLAVLYHYVLGMYAGLGYPFNTFLLNPNDKFNDFFHPLAAAALRDPYAYYAQTGIVQPYPPLVFLLLKPLTALPGYAALAFLFVVFGAFHFLVVRFVVRRSVESPLVRAIAYLVLGVCLYPVLFIVDRGSTEALVYILLGLFFYFYYIKKSTILSALFLGLAVSVKILPGILIVLYLSDRNFRGFIWAVFLSVAITALSFVTLSAVGAVPISNLVRDFAHQLGLYTQIYSFTPNGIDHRHTLWLYIQALNLGYRLFSFPTLLRIYDVAVVAVLGVIVYAVCFRSLPGWKKASVLLIAMVSLPSSVGDYALVHVFFALIGAVFWGEGAGGKRYVILFSLLLIPITYARITVMWISNLLYPLILLALLILIVRDAFVGREPSAA